MALRAPNSVFLWNTVNRDTISFYYIVHDEVSLVLIGASIQLVFYQISHYLYEVYIVKTWCILTQANYSA